MSCLRTKHPLPASLAWLVGVVLLGACGIKAITPGHAIIPEGTPTWSDLWAHLQEEVPYPYTTPLPPKRKTAVDGNYGKLDPREGTRAPCRRCVPYPPEGGLWLLRLEKGTYRILSTRSLGGWRSLGSFAVEGNRLYLFNDPHCMDATGIYLWVIDSEQLWLEVIKDECANGHRAITFTNYPWALREDS